MNYLKYYKNSKYELGKYDCWTFLQDLFKKERGIMLPDVPVFDDPDNESYLKSNIKHERLEKPQRGCLVFIKTKSLNHVGYAVSEKEYLHKTSNTGVIISKIPNTAEFYEVIND